ncbi:MAG: hypothetical protein Q9219_003115 [cf. Caloplaca sp. 3 TL-2023]
MPDFSTLGSLAPYHIVAYGTLLGSSVFQSFIGGVVAYRALPRAQFASLQTAIFPVYFSLQSALPVLLALTYPAVKSITGTSPSGINGFLAEQNRYSVLAPIATTFAISVANLVYLGPQTEKIMRLRKHQETRDGRKSYDPPPHSQAMQKLNKDFARMHGISAGLNLVALAATVWYGVSLSERIQ